MSDYLLEATGVSYRVKGRAIIDNVAVGVQHGEVLAIVGPNGAGKSTLLRLMSGDLVPSEGLVKVGGRPLKGYTQGQLAKHRAVLSQAVVLTFPFTAMDVALMGRHPHLSKTGESGEDVAKAQWALEKAEAESLKSRRYPTLSGGEQARVNLVRVLAQETPVILLDEPTAHLDPRHQHGALRNMRELAQAGAAVLVVVHDLNLAAVYADRVAMLAEGRLVACGSPGETLTEELLSSVFGVPFAVSRHPVLPKPLIVALPATPQRHDQADQKKGEFLCSLQPIELRP